MTKIQLGIAAAVLGFGVLAQIPNHDDKNMAGHAHDLSDQHAAMAAAGPGQGLTVQLAVTGMT